MISTENISHLYDGNDVTTIFAYTFEGVISADEIVVTLIEDPDAPEDAVTLDSSLYTVQLTQSRVLYPLTGSPLATGAQLSISRNVDYKQEVDLVNGGPYDAEVIEGALDKLAKGQQQLAAQIGRALTAPIYVDGVVGDLGGIILAVNGAREDAEDAATAAAAAVESGRRTAVINAIIFGS
jgi:hypothetical protein